MKLLILAAGYATRLYPLTRNQAKPLLPVAGRPMIEHVLATTHSLTGLDEILVVTNHRFADNFRLWAGEYRRHQPRSASIQVIDDQSTDDTNKLGAIGDIQLAIDHCQVRDDLLIIGGDNLFRDTLNGYVEFARAHGPTVGLYDVGNLEEIKKYNHIAWDEQSRITEFEEKPKVPRNTKAAICLYFYPAATLSLIRQYIDEGNNPDQPGRLVGWLYARHPVYVYEIKGPWLDIGSYDTLERAHQLFQ